MQLTSVLLLGFCLHLSATGISQTISFSGKNVPLEQVFKVIKKQTGYFVSYKANQVRNASPVTITGQNMPIEIFLHQALKDQPLDFSIKETTIFIKWKKELPAPVPVQPLLSLPPPVDITLSGVVTNNNNEPLEGVSVVVKGTQNGTVTDAEGRFQLSVPSATNVELEFSFVGFETMTIRVGNQTVFKVTMEQAVSGLDDIVVVGYGTQKKVNLTGAVTMVESEQISKRQVQNVGQALQGVVPGLNLVTNSKGGELNNTLNIDIRGMGTIGSGSRSGPLVLIDGAEGNMNVINPKDIESIAVLKDAAASSIYGARAAFGVILITTKRGKAGKTEINYNNNIRFDALIHPRRTMGAVNYVDYINRAAMNEGSAPIYSDLVIDRVKAFVEGTYENSPDSYWPVGTANEGQWRDLVANTDWYNTYYKNWTPSQEHNISVSGGNEKITYRISGGYLGQNGKIRFGHDNYKRYTLSARIGANISKFAKVNYSSSLISVDYDRPSYVSSSNSGWFFHNTERLPPIIPVKDPNGHYISGGTYIGIIQLLEGGRASDKQNTLSQQMQVILEPIRNWHITAEGNMRTDNFNNHMAILPVYDYDAFENRKLFIWDYWHSIGQSQIKETFSKSNYYSANVYTDFATDFLGEHSFKFLLGFNGEYQRYQSLNAIRDGLLSPSVPTIGTTTTNPQIKGDLNDWANAGYFGRINYNYKGRYLFEANGRYDGSSRFVGDNRWGFFPSFSAGWNVANEDFFSKFVSSISLLKLRASWGALGNMNTQNLYPFFLTMPITTSGGGWLINNQQPNVAGTPGIVSQTLTWERVESFDVGLDWAFFKNRLTGSFDYFRRNTKGMVGPAPQLPSILGTGVPNINNTDMKSFGYEVEMAWRDRINTVHYGIKVLFANDKQIITNYPNEIMNFSNWYSGKVNGEIWGFTTIGIAQSAEEMNNHLSKLNNGGQGYFGSNWAAGDIMYADLNGDGKVDMGAGTLRDPGDMHIIGNNYPQYKTGLDFNLSWKNVDFSMFWAGVLKRDYVIGVAEGNSLFWGANGNSAETIALVEHLDFWRPEGDPMGANPNGYYPRPLFAQGYKNKYPQTRYMLNAAYMRLKNIQIGYTFTGILSKKLSNSSSIRVFAAAENLITITPLTRLFDPEVLGGRWGPGKTYPLGKTLAAGLSVNF